MSWFFSSQVFSVLGNCSVVVKALCALVCVGYFLSFSETAMHVLAILPGNLLPPNFWVWTMATHNLIETHWWVMMVDVMVLILYGKLLEPLWGAQEMVIFYAVVNLVVALLTTLTYLFLYLLVANTDLLFNTHVHGLAGYLAGFSVSVKQTMPDHVIINSSFGKLRNGHVPLLMVVVAFVARIVGAVDPPFPIMFAWGFTISWVYLRFYQRHSNGTRGDTADSFAFASFFPKSFQPFIAVLGNTVFSMLVTIKICKKVQRKFETVASPVVVVSLPGTEAHDAERRRQLALKALNERLTKTVSPAWPSMEDDEVKPSALTEGTQVTVLPQKPTEEHETGGTLPMVSQSNEVATSRTAEGV